MKSFVRKLVPGSIREKHNQSEEAAIQSPVTGSTEAWPAATQEQPSLGTAQSTYLKRKSAGRRNGFGLKSRSQRESLHTDTAHMPAADSPEPEPQLPPLQQKTKQKHKKGADIPQSLAIPEQDSSAADQDPLKSRSNLELLCRRELNSLYDLSDPASNSLGGPRSQNSPSHSSMQLSPERIGSSLVQWAPDLNFDHSERQQQEGSQDHHLQSSPARSEPQPQSNAPQSNGGSSSKGRASPAAAAAAAAALGPDEARRLAGATPRHSRRVAASPGSGSHLADLLAPRTPELTSPAAQQDDRIRTVPYDTQAFWNLASDLHSSSFGQNNAEGRESFHWQRPYKSKRKARGSNASAALLPAVEEPKFDGQAAADRQPGHIRGSKKNEDPADTAAGGQHAPGTGQQAWQESDNLKPLSTGSMPRSAGLRQPSWDSAGSRGLGREDLKRIFRSLCNETEAYKKWLAEAQNESAVAELERGTLVDQVDELLAERKGLTRQLHQAHKQLHAAEQEEMRHKQGRTSSYVHELGYLRSQLQRERHGRAQAEEAQVHAEQQMRAMSPDHDGLRSALHAAKAQARAQRQQAKALQEAVDRLEADNCHLQQQCALAQDRAHSQPQPSTGHLTQHVLELSDNLGRTMAAAQQALGENQDLSAQLQATQQELQIAQERCARLADSEAAAAEASAALQAARAEAGRLREHLGSDCLVSTADVDTSSGGKAAAEVASLRSALEQACSANSSIQQSADEQVRALRAEVSRQAQLLRRAEDSDSHCLSCKAKDREVHALKQELDVNGEASQELQQLQQQLSDEDVVPAAQARDLQAQVHQLYSDLEEQYYQKEQQRRHMSGSSGNLQDPAEGRQRLHTFRLGVEGEMLPSQNGGSSHFEDIFTTTTSSSSNLGVGD